MAKSAGDKITELDYNTLQSSVASILGSPAGSTDTTATGYNQAVSSAQVSVGNSITEAQWDNLRSDITKCYTHQFGTAPTITNVTTSTTIGATEYNQYEALVTTISGDPNRYTVAAGQFSLVAGQTATLAAGWNGVRTHQFTASFSSATEAKAFFNAGGEVRIDLVMTYTGSEQKTLDWQAMMAAINTIKFGYKQTLSAADADTNANGYYDIVSSGTTWVQVATEPGTSPYAENDILIYVRANSGSQLEFRVELRDDDAGDQRPGTPPLGPAEDENVNGATTSTITIKQPSGANVSVPAPTIAFAAGNQFS